MKFFTADTHFNHKNIIKYCDRKPGPTARVFQTVSHMNEHIIHRWNAQVGPSDTVYHLGDVFFGPKDEAIRLCSRLNGYKILIKGSYDLKPKPEIWEQAGFSEVITLGHRKTYRLEVSGRVYFLSHYPYLKDLEAYDERTYLHYHAPESHNIPLLHGHVHTRWQTKGNMINVGVDVWDYCPVSLEMIDTLVEASKGNP